MISLDSYLGNYFFEKSSIPCLIRVLSVFSPKSYHLTKCIFGEISGNKPHKSGIMTPERRFIMPTYILEAKLLEAYWLLERQLKSIDAELESLPRGTIVKKHIKGHTYSYLQWHEDGKTKNLYLKQGTDEKYHIEQRLMLRGEYTKLRKRILSDMQTIEKILGDKVELSDTFHRRKEIKETKEGWGWYEWQLGRLPQLLPLIQDWPLIKYMF